MREFRTYGSEGGREGRDRYRAPALARDPAGACDRRARLAGLILPGVIETATFTAERRNKRPF